eukprot:NODE_643_length_1984_cov_5.446419_g595_i0.p1 GENE.NODE_643_length_1984_cov_5.446419_g595_i0~~NODE_643_length_1984_cov_5.446419_g595_i0.p1  ORF type:complete len:658 (+),score=157.20 NODE_643_length_1984_cov_5.446419_g595_i0:1-1974(+)
MHMSCVSPIYSTHKTLKHSITQRLVLMNSGFCIAFVLSLSLAHFLKSDWALALAGLLISLLTLVVVCVWRTHPSRIAWMWLLLALPYPFVTLINDSSFNANPFFLLTPALSFAFMAGVSPGALRLVTIANAAVILSLFIIQFASGQSAQTLETVFSVPLHFAIVAACLASAAQMQQHVEHALLFNARILQQAADKAANGDFDTALGLRSQLDHYTASEEAFFRLMELLKIVQTYVPDGLSSLFRFNSIKSLHRNEYKKLERRNSAGGFSDLSDSDPESAEHKSATSAESESPSKKYLQNSNVVETGSTPSTPSSVVSSVPASFCIQWDLVMQSSFEEETCQPKRAPIGSVKPELMRKRITVMLINLRNIHDMLDNLEALEQTHAIFLKMCLQAIWRNGGAVEAFGGGRVWAFWMCSHEKAAQCAVALEENFKRSDLRVNCAIVYDMAVVGNIGCVGAIGHTIISPMMLKCSLLLKCNEELKTQTLFNKSYRDKVQFEMHCKPVDIVQFGSHPSTVRELIFQPFGYCESHTENEWMYQLDVQQEAIPKPLQLYQSAFSLFFNSRFQECLNLLTEPNEEAVLEDPHRDRIKSLCEHFLSLEGPYSRPLYISVQLDFLNSSGSQTMRRVLSKPSSPRVMSSRGSPRSRITILDTSSQLVY